MTDSTIALIERLRYDAENPLMQAAATELTTLLERCEKAEEWSRLRAEDIMTLGKEVGRLSDERDTAIRERDELQKMFDHANTMESFWCDKSKELAGKNDTLRAERDEARKALEPFAKEPPHGMGDDSWPICENNDFTYGHLRRARASSGREGGE
jgi:hypothetical protein